MKRAGETLARLTGPNRSLQPTTDRSHPVIALSEGSAPVAETPRAPRRSPKRLGDQGPKCAPVRVAKSRDAGKVKVSVYLSVETARKLAVASVIRSADQSDLADAILGNALSSVTFYDRSTRPSADPLTVTEFGTDPAA
jgi:hypothetical protein